MPRKKVRPNWNLYFLGIAQAVSKRASCPRASVGAVIVKENRILATGYNGAANGEEHCIDIGCDVVGEHCQRAIHAETNAVAQAARYGIAVEGAILYYWDSLGRPPNSCTKCWQVMKAAGIVKVVGRFGTVNL